MVMLTSQFVFWLFGFAFQISHSSIYELLEMRPQAASSWLADLLTLGCHKLPKLDACAKFSKVDACVKLSNIDTCFKRRQVFKA
jgi:hypothetical protein